MTFSFRRHQYQTFCSHLEFIWLLSIVRFQICLQRACPVGYIVTLHWLYLFSNNSTVTHILAWRLPKEPHHWFSETTAMYDVLSWRLLSHNWHCNICGNMFQKIACLKNHITLVFRDSSNVRRSHLAAAGPQLALQHAQAASRNSCTFKMHLLTILFSFDLVLNHRCSLLM